MSGKPQAPPPVGETSTNLPSLQSVVSHVFSQGPLLIHCVGSLLVLLPYTSVNDAILLPILHYKTHYGFAIGSSVQNAFAKCRR